MVLADIRDRLSKQLVVKIEGAMEKRPEYLYKIVSMHDWKKSDKTVHLSKMDADCIHFAIPHQLGDIVKKYWSEAVEFLILKVETAKLPGRLVLEANLEGVKECYHLYQGSIPLNAVVESMVIKD